MIDQKTLCLFVEPDAIVQVGSNPGPFRINTDPGSFFRGDGGLLPDFRHHALLQIAFFPEPIVYVDRSDIGHFHLIGRQLTDLLEKIRNLLVLAVLELLQNLIGKGLRNGYFGFLAPSGGFSDNTPLAPDILQDLTDKLQTAVYVGICQDLIFRCDTVCDRISAGSHSIDILDRNIQTLNIITCHIRLSFLVII